MKLYILAILKVIGETMGKKELLADLKDKGFPSDILAAFEKVHRDRFVPLKYHSKAYEDIALPLEVEGATISQPYTIAFMLKHLTIHPNAKVLEIGSGSGYVLALLSQLAQGGEIHGVELNGQLVDAAKKRLEKYSQVSIHKANGKQGFMRYAPYDRILVSVAFPYVPYHLLDQLKINGILVAAVNRKIVRLIKRIDGVSEKAFPGFMFVPLQ